MKRYADILRSPHVAALVASALLARLPIGINALAIVLYLREQTGSFAIAGAVSGMLAAGSGFGAPIQGRLVDRIGARRVLLPLAVVHAVALGAIVALTELGAPSSVKPTIAPSASAWTTASGSSTRRAPIRSTSRPWTGAPTPDPSASVPDTAPAIANEPVCSRR